MDHSFSTGLAWLLGVLATLATIIMAIRRRPPVVEEMYKDYATKTELAAVEMRTNQKFESSDDATRRQMDELKGDIRAINITLDRNAKDVERAIGRVEGELKRIKGEG